MELQRVDEFKISPRGFIACRKRYCRSQCKAYDGEGTPSFTTFGGIDYEKSFKDFESKNAPIKKINGINFSKVEITNGIDMGFVDLFRNDNGLSCSVFEKKYDDGSDLVILECVADR